MVKPTLGFPRLQLDPLLRERLAHKPDPRLAIKVDLTPPPPKPKAKKKKGGGGKPAFTPGEAVQLQDAYRRELDEDSKLKDFSLAERRVRRLLPMGKSNLSSRTIKRYVLWPVLGKRTSCYLVRTK
jgi:hypothetical protein